MAIRDVLLPGGFTVEVLGESHYQEALEAIAGGKWEDPSDMEVTAYLIREPDNAYDRNAIAVYIRGRIVGYIGRDDAAEYAPILDELWVKYQCRAACQARLKGGWRRYIEQPHGGLTTDEGHFGVTLALAPADELIGTRELRVIGEQG
jgi:hypothetical protein